MPPSPDMGGEPYQQAARFFEDIFPGAVINLDDVPLPPKALENLSAAGFGAAEVVLPDGTVQVATFLAHETPVTQMVGTIYDMEVAGAVPVGSHNQALDDIIAGTFHEKWGNLFI